MSKLVVEHFVRAWIRDKTYLRAAERVLDDGLLPRVLAVYFRGTDDIERGVAEALAASGAAPATPAQSARLAKAVERYWQWTDTAIGRILTYYEDSSRFVVVVSAAPRGDGIFIAEGPGVRVGAKLGPVSLYDVTPTLLAYSGLANAVDMDGRVINGLFSGGGARPGSGASRPTYEDPPTTAPGAGAPAEPAASDARLVEDLRSLGLVE